MLTRRFGCCGQLAPVRPGPLRYLETKAAGERSEVVIRPEPIRSDLALHPARLEVRATLTKRRPLMDGLDQTLLQIPSFFIH